MADVGPRTSSGRALSSNTGRGPSTSGRGQENFFDRTVRNLRAAWRDVASSVRNDGAIEVGPDLDDGDAGRIREQMRACLERRGGEVSARARAAALGRAYLSLNRNGRQRFLAILATDFDTDPLAVGAAAAALEDMQDWRERKNGERRLRVALEPPRRRLLTQFNALPEGVKFLVDMRGELLDLAREEPTLAVVEADLKDLLASWFDIGFLELRRIAWDTPAAILEKLIAYEAVHEIRSWDDLKNRLASDRRCYAFFHPRMPDEPLIFVEVALGNGVAGNIQALLDVSAPLTDAANADTAIFYSISNAQRGLDGISFGDFLIKRVVDVLSAEIDGLENFVTLSPIPGFRRWLDEHRGDGELLSAAEVKALAPYAAGAPSSALPHALIEGADWPGETKLSIALERPMMRLCAEYLINAKRPDGRAIDPVANFHLSNGARMERLNWLGDTSPKGLAQSAGIMINYRYRAREIEDNHEAYVGEGRIPAAATVRGHLR
jgi:malonyl-CoA decarboxylase